MIFQNKPEGFEAKFDVVSCFLEHDGKILVLHRQDHKPQGGTWSLPAGKVEDQESLLEGLAREIREELGVELEIVPEHYVRTVYVTHHGYSFAYHMYRLVLDRRVEIDLNKDEHKDYDWVSPESALKLPLIDDEDACIKLVYFD